MRPPCAHAHHHYPPALFARHERWHSDRFPEPTGHRERVACLPDARHETLLPCARQTRITCGNHPVASHVIVTTSLNVRPRVKPEFARLSAQPCVRLHSVPETVYVAGATVPAPPAS